MFRSGKKKVVGLDIGTSSVKAVELEIFKNNVEIIKSSSLKLSTEGILNEEELFTSIRNWIERSNWQQSEICAGLPQYLTTTQLRDFPPTNRENMKNLVDYETRHLAGLSEDRFINDYHIMPPQFGRRNPVLIGICRASVIEEKIDSLHNINLNLVELSMNSMAIINTLFHLHPETIKDEKPQMIIDIGYENTIVIIIAGGQILFISSLLFGMIKYHQALKECEGLNDEQAEFETVKGRLFLNEEDSPFSRTTRALETELLNVIDQWRAQERVEIGNESFSNIWLCGGGSKLHGLDIYLSKQFGCETEKFGPNSESGKCDPELAIAYGLALQGIGHSHISISLCPEHVKWDIRRNRFFNYLVGSSILIITLISIITAKYYFSLRSDLEKSREETGKLNSCEKIIPELEDTIKSIRYYEMMLIPLVKKGNCIIRFLDTVNEVTKVCAPDNLFVALGDEKSFNAGKTDEKEEQEKKEKKEKQLKRSPIMFLTSHHRQKESLKPADSPNKIVVENMKPEKNLILIGFTLCTTKKEHYQAVRRIQQQLNRSPLFNSPRTKVDILSDEELNPRKDILASWQKILDMKQKKVRSYPPMRYRHFAFKLPFAVPSFNERRMTEKQSK